MLKIDFEDEDVDPSTNTKRLFGSLDTNDFDVPHAVYIAEFPLTQQGDRTALIDLLLGKWGEGTTPQDRVIFRVAFFLNPERFLVVDASPRPASAAAAFSRQKAFDSGKIELVFQILDAVWEQDTRIPWENAGDGKTQQ